MILGSHNSWSYLPPKKWWQRLIAFTARCQRLTVDDQYDLGVRCFDLRIRFFGGIPHIVHNDFDYGLLSDHYRVLEWLDKQGDCSVRVVHDVRRSRDWNADSIALFMMECRFLMYQYKNIKFWCGRNLYNWKEDFEFEYKPECTEKYSSVCSPRLIDDWWPWLFAKRNNYRIREKGGPYKNDEILLIDYVDIP